MRSKEYILVALTKSFCYFLNVLQRPYLLWPLWSKIFWFTIITVLHTTYNDEYEVFSQFQLALARYRSYFSDVSTIFHWHCHFDSINTFSSFIFFIATNMQNITSLEAQICNCFQIFDYVRFQSDINHCLSQREAVEYKCSWHETSLMWDSDTWGYPTPRTQHFQKILKLYSTRGFKFLYVSFAVLHLGHLLFRLRWNCAQCSTNPDSMWSSTWSRRGHTTSWTKLLRQFSTKRGDELNANSCIDQPFTAPSILS